MRAACPSLPIHSEHTSTLRHAKPQVRVQVHVVVPGQPVDGVELAIWQCHHLGEARRDVTARLRARSEKRDYLISGKDYLFPLFHVQLRVVAGIRESAPGLKVRLAQHAALDIDPILVAAVQERAA